jgi:hypothetical protein
MHTSSLSNVGEATRKTGDKCAHEKRHNSDHVTQEQILEAVSCTLTLAPGPPDQRKTDRLMQIPRHARALHHPRLIDHPFLHLH